MHTVEDPFRLLSGYTNVLLRDLGFLPLCLPALPRAAAKHDVPVDERRSCVAKLSRSSTFFSTLRHWDIPMPSFSSLRSTSSRQRHISVQTLGARSPPSRNMQLPQATQPPNTYWRSSMQRDTKVSHRRMRPKLSFTTLSAPTARTEELNLL